MATYNNIYRINFARLSLLLLPSMLRKQILAAYLRAAYSQFDFIPFIKYREDTNYRLTHNGQVCYLRAALNDRFDAEQRRVEIGNGQAAKFSIIYWRAQNKPFKPTRIIGRRGTATGAAFDFTVIVPTEMYGNAEIKQKITALTNEYKLAGKQFIIIPKL